MSFTDTTHSQPTQPSQPVSPAHSQGADRPALVLIGGHWLGAWAWDSVVAHLDADQHHVIAMTLPGFDAEDPQRTERTLADQVSAIVDVLADHGAAQQPAVLVAHSGANAPVSVVLDQHPEWVQRVVWVDSGPVAPGTVFAPDLPAEVAEVAVPPLEELGQQASLDGVDAATLEAFRARAVPVPATIMRARIDLTNDARRDVPTTLVCCSLPSAQVQEWAAAGSPMFSEVTQLTEVEYVDLPTGHWPMWSRSADLAAVIQAAASATR